MSSISVDEFKEHLQRYYDAIDSNYTERVGTKKWCLTVWVACIVLTAKEAPTLSYLNSLLLVLTPVVLFWFMDATQGGYGKILIDKATEMEGILSRGLSESINPLDFYYISGRNVDKRIKTASTVHAMFRMETVFTFYLLLAFASPMILHVLNPSG